MTETHRSADSGGRCPKCGTRLEPYAEVDIGVGTLPWVLVKYIGPERTIHYLSVAAGWFDWSPDHMKALRLSRRSDGDALARIVEDAETVEEHSWE